MSAITKKEYHKITTHSLLEMKQCGDKISMLTAYDYVFAKIIDESGIDIILVGDSASNIVGGYDTTIPITIDDMIYHGKCVVRAVKRALVVIDMPFGTYQGNSKKALCSAIKIMQQTNGHAVKLEGGKEILSSVKKIISAGIPVMGHLGLTPQSIYKFGTYTTRGKSKEEAIKIKHDAKILESAGVFAIVLEKVPFMLAKEISEEVSVPVIGIGAGMYVDGQVLVTHDMLGITTEFSPKFIRRYNNFSEQMNISLKTYIEDIKNKTFPSKKESYN